MSSFDSNLSGAAFGYDLVCAVSEDGINVTMYELLASSEEELCACWIMDESGQYVSKSVADLTAEIGKDPFSIKNGTNRSDPVMEKLNQAGFVYGFKAKLGLPAGVAPDQLPPVIRLDKGSSQVTYQLFFAEFSVIVMNYNPGGRNTFTNVAQQADAPWLFQFIVNLDLNPADETPYAKLPPAVRARIKNVDPDTMFSVQQLLIDVTTRALEGSVAIPGLDPSSPAYVALTQVFIGAYWDKMAPDKNILVGYTVSPSSSSAVGSSSIVPTDLNFMTDPYRDAGGKATDEGIYTLNYLVMTGEAKMPPPVPFTWNWLDPSDDVNFHGIMAVRRDVFADFLSALISADSNPLSIDTNMYCSHSGSKLSAYPSYGASGNPAKWTRTASGGQPGPDGYTPLLEISHDCPSYNGADTNPPGAHLGGEFNYNMSGSVSTLGSTLRIQVYAHAYMRLEYDVAGITVAKFSGNIVDLTITADYAMSIKADGTMSVVMSPSDPSVVDRSESVDVSWWDTMIGLSGVGDMVNGIKDALVPALTSAVIGVDRQIADLMNGSSAWLYPGGKTFFFKDVAFSNFQDLVCRITYRNPERGIPAVIDGDHLAARHGRRHHPKEHAASPTTVV